MTLEPGDAAPEFALADQRGETIRLSDFRGKKALIYFYPMADTPGCTTQSCSVRDARLDFADAGVAVLGISPDAPDAQRAFDEKFGLGFPLLCDTEHAAAEAFGVWGEQDFKGHKWTGIRRSSFLIDEEGRISRAWYGVRPEDTVPNVVEVIAEG